MNTRSTKQYEASSRQKQWRTCGCWTNEEAPTHWHADRNNFWSFIRTEALTATGTQITVLRDVTLCNAYIGTDVSEKYVKSIFKVLIKMPRLEFT